MSSEQWKIVVRKRCLLPACLVSLDSLLGLRHHCSLLTAHCEYHSILVSATRNHFAAIFNDMIFPLASRIIGHYLKNMNVEDKARHILSMPEIHKSILEAIERRQPDEAKEITINHLKLFKDIAGSGEIPMIFSE